MSILRRLALPFVALSSLVLLIALPLYRRRRRRILAKGGWVELRLAGEVVEFRTGRDVVQTFVRRALKRADPPRVVLSRLRKLVDEMISDSCAKGIVVRIGPLGGGWAAADTIRGELVRLREAGRHVVVHIESNADNRQAMIAATGSRVLMTPTGTMGAAGMAVSGLFLRDALDRLGITVEAIGHGRYKSAPDQFTRRDRSEPDAEQTKALVDQLDDALLQSLMNGRILNREDAAALVDEAPMVGVRAKEAGFCDDLARDEDLVDVVKAVDEREDAPVLVGAGRYLEARRLPNIWPSKERRVGIVRVHGPILDQVGRVQLPDQQVAVAESVVNDLRAALRDPKIGAVVMHVDSRGGSVTASDQIYAAAKRLDREKPVIACFGDIAASGGYYVACGARAIVASELTLTGSIGVFGIVPTWPKLTERWQIGHDVLKNRKHAAILDPWQALNETDREHAQRGVSSMYETFIGLVGESRSLERDEVDAVAQGRVWTGKDARQQRLVDDLGGFTAAVELARREASGPLHDDPVLVTARGVQGRPMPFNPQGREPASPGEVALDGTSGASGATPAWLAALLRAGALPMDPAVLELAVLAWSGPPGRWRALAYAML